MVQVVGGINGAVNENRDVHYLKGISSIITGGVVNGLGISQPGGTGTDLEITNGFAVVPVNRDNITPSEEFMVTYVNTDLVTFPFPGNTKKIFVKIFDANVNDGTLNTEADGTGIGEIQSADNYPTKNFIPLCEIDASGDLVLVDNLNSLISGNINISDFNLSDLGPSYLKDLVDVDNNLTPGADEVLAYNFLNNQFEAKSLSNIASIKRMVCDVIYGEDIDITGDGEGSVFYGCGKAETKIEKNETDGNTLELGADGDPVRIGQFFVTPIASQKSDFIRHQTFNIRKVGNPIDDVEFNLFEADRITPVVGFIQQTINGSTISITYEKQTVDMQDILIDPSTEYFLEISRSGGQDAVNYYEIEYGENTVAGAGHSTNNTSTRTDKSFDLVFSIHYGKDFSPDIVWLSDVNYLSTNKSDGIVLESGLALEIKKMQFAGKIVQTTIIPCATYYLNKTAGPISPLVNKMLNTHDVGALQALVEAIFFEITVPAGEVGDVNFEVRHTGTNALFRVYINGVNVGEMYTGTDTNRIPMTLNIGQTYPPGTDLDIKVVGINSNTGPISWFRNIEFELSEYSSLPLFNNIIGDNPFIIGSGDTTTQLNLLINEQKFEENYFSEKQINVPFNPPNNPGGTTVSSTLEYTPEKNGFIVVKLSCSAYQRGGNGASATFTAGGQIYNVNSNSDRTAVNFQDTLMIPMKKGVPTTMTISTYRADANNNNYIHISSTLEKFISL